MFRHHSRLQYRAPLPDRHSHSRNRKRPLLEPRRHENVESLDNCITRLRLEVKDGTLVDEKKIKAAGVAGVMRPSQTAVQVIIGTKVQFVADEMAKMLK